MDLLKLLEPYNEDLDHHAKGMGFTVKITDNKRELLDIWIEVQKKHREEIYGDPNHAIDDCANCMNSFIKNLYNWRNIYRQRGMGVTNEDFTRVMSKDQIEFKGVPQKEVKIVSNGHDLNEVIKMKWPQFKTYCKDHGLSVKGKKRAELMKELGL